MSTPLNNNNKQREKMSNINKLINANIPNYLSARKRLRGAKKKELIYTNNKNAKTIYNTRNLQQKFSDLNAVYKQVLRSNNKNFLDYRFNTNSEIDKIVRNKFITLFTKSGMTNTLKSRRNVINAIVKFIGSLDYTNPKSIITLNAALGALANILVTTEATNSGNGRGGAGTSP